MSERASHQCHKTGCDSQALYATKFQLDCCAPGARQIIKMNCSIKVCEAHRKENEVRDYLLSPHNRETITTSLMESGYAEPDFLSAKILFEPIPQKNFSIITASVRELD